jgi:hypothetical protein
MKAGNGSAEEPGEFAGLLRLWAERTLLVIVVLVALTYAGDYCVFQLRGKPVKQLTVNRYLAVPLKGSKTEFDFEGTQPQTCVQALFPWAGSSPCWYLRRHLTQADKI